MTEDILVWSAVGFLIWFFAEAFSGPLFGLQVEVNP